MILGDWWWDMCWVACGGKRKFYSSWARANSLGGQDASLRAPSAPAMEDVLMKVSWDLVTLENRPKWSPSGFPLGLNHNPQTVEKCRINYQLPPKYLLCIFVCQQDLIQIFHDRYMTPKQATRDAQLSFLVVDAVETSANGSPPLGKNSLIVSAMMPFSQLSNACLCFFFVFRSLGNF